MTVINPDARRGAYARSRQCCEDCGDKLPLDMHHLRRYRPDPHDGQVLIAGVEEQDDLVALCRGCHYARHRDPNGEYWWDEEEMHAYW